MKKSIILGLAAGIGLTAFYFLFFSAIGSFSHAIEQFRQFWYWIFILAIGFGIQFGLFIFIKNKQKVAPGKTLAGSGTISTGSMVACCLHHLADILPVLGLAAASLFLIQYQNFFILLGVLANLIGIFVMLEIIKKTKLMGYFKKLAIVISLPVLGIVFSISYNQANQPLASASSSAFISAIDLPTKTDNQNGVYFQITPLDFNLGKKTAFEIKIETHSGSLDFDVAKVSALEDDLGRKYQPIEWQGGVGGHHLAGVLEFPAVPLEAKTIKLVVKDIYGVKERSFEWSLNK